MAFNIDKKGGAVAIVKGGQDKDTIIYLDANYVKGEGEDKLGKKIVYFDKVNLPKNSVFEQYPNTSRERDCGMIVGASGSGKSYYVDKYAANYKKAYKGKRPVYFFSTITEDSSINSKNIKRVRIDEDMLNNPLSCEDVKESLCIFDDVEQLKDMRIKCEVFRFINEILTAGRHTDTSIFLIVHYGSNKPYLRDMLNECHTFTYFPRGANRSIKYLLENYIGVDSEEIKKIKKLNTRWATVFKQYPNCVLTERNLFMLADND